MAQYTPNFNLYEPDSSDDFADFRTEFNNNMDIIDQNLGGGGGSGGHTIYDKDGNALAQESGLQFTGNVNVSDDSGNGRTVVDILGGGGNVYGFAIDESRKLFEGTLTNFTQTLEYTATEDALALVDYSGSNGANQWFLINGVIIPFQVLSSGRESFTVPIRKGDKISARHSSDNEGCFFHLVCYGIKQGTNGIFAPVIYSDNERVIGVWRDNKPLYQRVWDFGSDLVIPNNSFYTTSIDASNIETIVEGFGIYSTGATRYDLMANTNGTNIRLQADRTNGSANVRYFVMTYTKISDVAGSGDYNTYGVPTHHYSTSEQVVGTWINGKPLYEKTIDGGMIIAGANWNTFAHGVTDMDVCTSIEAILVNNTGTNVLNAYRPSLDLGVVIERNGANMRYMNTWFGNNEAQIICTIRYTKTTD